MPADISLRVIDADSHLTEVPDLWTSRLPRKWQDLAPKLVPDNAGIQYWQMGDRKLHAPAYFAQGETKPAQRWEELDPACYDTSARLKWMDRYGIYSQVLFPNVVAFESYAVMAQDPEFQRLVYEAYNDHQIDVASVAPERFITIAAVPFWDVDASIAEMERCRAKGHRGVLWANTMEAHGLPIFTDPHWDRFYAAAQDLEMPINFHVATGGTEASRAGSNATAPGETRKNIPAYVKVCALTMMSNGATIAELITSGLCDRFPRLNFVSVESGFGYVPFLLDALDWQWATARGLTELPDRLLPSEYFKRQIYTMFWFETRTLGQLEEYPDNVMFETDFPHPTSLAPRPYTVGIPDPDDTIRRHIDAYPDDLMRKILYENAARIYHLD